MDFRTYEKPLSLVRNDLKKHVDSLPLGKLSGLKIPSISPVAKLSIATGHAMQIYNCLNCPRQL